MESSGEGSRNPSTGATDGGEPAANGSAASDRAILSMPDTIGSLSPPSNSEIVPASPADADTDFIQPVFPHASTGSARVGTDPTATAAPPAQPRLGTSYRSGDHPLHGDEDAFWDGESLALWGMTGSGKTTFLRAIRAAAVGRLNVPGRWQVFADPSADRHGRQVDDAREVALGREIPVGTLREEVQRWRIHGDVPVRRPWWRARRSTDETTIDVPIETLDRAGGDFRHIGTTVPDAEVERLVQAKGFVYLFDPTQERKNAKVNYDYFDQLFARLQRDHRGETPQHVAVCVAKFDDETIFRESIAAGWVNQDAARPRQPRVLDKHAEGYFTWLCERFGTVDLYNAFGSFRHVRYYASSAMGFNLKGGEFDPIDPFNYYSDGAVIRQRGAISPINVLEPLVNLIIGLRGGVS